MKIKQIAPFLMMTSLSLTGFTAYRFYKQNFSHSNPDLSVRNGLGITRQPKKVMAVTAHHDDLEVLAGGTLRLLGLSGSNITVVVCTAGEKQQNSRSNAEEIRNREQKDAGMILGYNDIQFLHLTDMGLAHTPLFQELLQKEWDELKPDLVMAIDPAFPLPYVNHPDHLAVGRTVLNLMHSGEVNKAQVLFYGTKQPNTAVETTEVLEDKIQAVLCHRSQLKTWPFVYKTLIKNFDRLMGMQPGIPFAENFRSMSLPDPEDEIYYENRYVQTPEPAFK